MIKKKLLALLLLSLPWSLLCLLLPSGVFAQTINGIASQSVTAVPATSLGSQSANTVTANVTSGSASPTAAAIPSGIQNYVAGTGYNQATAHQLYTALLCADTSASGTAQSCTTSPSFTPAANDCVIYTTTTANTGALTLNVNASAADAVQKWLGTAVASGDVPANHAQLACLDGSSHWQLSTIGNAPSGGGSLPTTTAGQTYYSSGTTGSATSGILVGVTAGAITGAGISSGGLEFGGTHFIDLPYPTGAVTFNGSCASGTTASCAINNSSSLLDPNGGVVWAGVGDGSNDGEWIKYTSANTTTLTGLTRGYWGSTAATHGTTVDLQLVVQSWTTSTTTAPYMVMLQDGAIFFGAFTASGTNNLGQAQALIASSGIYSTNGSVCFSNKGNSKDCAIYGGAASLYLTGDSNNAVAAFGSNALQYSIATQGITGNGTLTAITNAVTPAMNNNQSAAAAGTGGVLTSHCTIIAQQATSGTVAFGIKASATPGHIWVKEQDSWGADLAPAFTTITSTTTTQTSGTVTPTAFATNYATDLWIAMDPGTSNSPTIQLYASASANTLTIEPGTGCTAWM